MYQQIKKNNRILNRLFSHSVLFLDLLYDKGKLKNIPSFF